MCACVCVSYFVWFSLALVLRPHAHADDLLPRFCSTIPLSFASTSALLIRRKIASKFIAFDRSLPHSVSYSLCFSVFFYIYIYQYYTYRCVESLCVCVSVLIYTFVFTTFSHSLYLACFPLVLLCAFISVPLGLF